MHQKVESFILKHKLLTENDKVIVGVSGGTDSVALLHLLHTKGYNCIVAHCNFHLRKEESMRDEEFVKNMALEMRLPFYKIDFETFNYAESNKISIEMAARDLRYKWFYELLTSQKATVIAVAHHADDSIETMLMNLVRGSGLRGLTGIPVRNGKVIRPLLCCSRQEIENYLIVNNLEHNEDTTNASSDYTRNKIRNELLPLMEEINPSVRETFYQTLNRFEGIHLIYNQAIERIKENIIVTNNYTIKIDINLLKKQVDIPTILFELLYPYGFSSPQIVQIVQLLDAESGKQFYSENYRLVKDRKYLIICKLNEIDLNEYWISENINSLNSPFAIQLTKKMYDPEFDVSKEKNCIHVDLSTLTFPLLLRRWREGDTFYPFGMNKPKKISDYFIDSKLTLIEKEQSWLLISGIKVVWIVGQRMDNRFRITEKTKSILEIKI